MDSSKSLVVVGSVKLDMEGMLGLEVNHHVIDVLHFAGTSSHGFGREVSVASRTVPVREKFWLEGDGDTELFGTSVEEISSHGHVITLLNACAWTNLEFPLSWHDLSIGTGNFDTRVEAAFVMSIVEGSSVGDVSTD